MQDFVIAGPSDPAEHAIWAAAVERRRQALADDNAKRLAGTDDLVCIKF